MRKRHVVVTALAVAALAGCGTGGKPSGVASLTGSNGGGSTTTTVSKADTAKLYANWAQCMRDHGVNMADPTFSGDGQVSINASGGSKASMDTAMTACQALHDAAQKASGGNKPAGQKPDPTKMRNFAKCMRAHGLPDFPDPSPDGGMKIQAQAGQNSDLDPNNPTFQNAQKACQSIIGAPKGGEKIQVSGGPGGPGGAGDSGSGFSSVDGGK
jgi:hypothetical protein